MNYLSICSGIEAATVAWHPLGWRAVAFSEIDKFPCALLDHYYPSVPNFGDMTLFKEWPDAAGLDVLVGGTPCQAFSVAGLREGLADPRGNLTLTYLAIAARYRPRWVVWENVPGVLSDRTGAFGALLGGLAKLGYGWAYRVLDAQFFRVAQQRRRVFVVGCLGGWPLAGAVLFERESLSGNPAPRRQTGKDVAPTIAARTRGGGGLGTDAELDGALIAHTLRAEGFDASEDGTGRGIPLVSMCLNAGGMGRVDSETETMIPVAFTCKDYGGDAGELSPTLRAMGHHESHANAGGQVAVAYSITPSNSNKDYNARAVDKAQAITAGGNRPSARGGDLIAFAQNQREELRTLEIAGSLSTIRRGDAKNETLLAELLRVRRLTPRECERLQGFVDDYTLIPYRRGIAKDGPRYKAIGNSMAVPVMRWIGERIQAVDEIRAAA